MMARPPLLLLLLAARQVCAETIFHTASPTNCNMISPRSSNLGLQAATQQNVSLILAKADLCKPPPDDITQSRYFNSIVVAIGDQHSDPQAPFDECLRAGLLAFNMAKLASLVQSHGASGFLVIYDASEPPNVYYYISSRRACFMLCPNYN